MANELKVKNGLIVYSSGSANALDVQGSQGQLFSVTDTLSGSLFSVNDISGIPIVEVLSDNIVKLGTFNDEAIIVTGSRVGMGISAPVAKLHISGSSGSGLFEIDSNSSQNIIFVSGSGNVGIGTNTPQQKLTVSNHIQINSNGDAQLSGADQSGVRSSVIILRSQTHGGMEFSTNYSIGRLVFKTGAGSSERMRIESNGNIGVGITQPSALLHISGSSGSGLFEIDSDSSQNIIYVSGSGNVGIGSNTPSAKLFVNGNILANSSVAAHWGSGLLLSENILSIVRGTSPYGLGIRYTNTWDYYQGHIFGSTANYNSTAAVDASILSIIHGWSPTTNGSTNYRPFGNYYTVNAAGVQTGTVTGIFLNATETNLGGARHNLIDLRVNNSSKFSVSNVGNTFVSGTLGIGKTPSVYNLDVSGSGNFTNGLTVTGSVIVSGSSTFTNIGPAVFSGSVSVTGALTASYFVGDGSMLTGVATPAPIRRHDYTGSYSYCGIAPSGSSESSNVWNIDRIEIFTDGSVLVASASLVSWTGRYTHVYV